MDHKIIRIVKLLYNNTENYVGILYNSKISESFKTNERLRQGGALSPLMFIININKNGKNVRAMHYDSTIYVGYDNEFGLRMIWPWLQKRETG